MKTIALTGMLLAALWAVPAAADSSHAQHGAASAQPADMAEGLVRKVDKAAAKLTIKHGPLTALNMPPMTMVFRVADPAMLDAVQAGDQVRFKASDVDGALTVTDIRKLK